MVGALASRLPVRPKGAAIRPKAEMGPLTELTPKHRLLIDYCVNGVPENKRHLLDWLNRNGRQLVPNEPLTIEEGARVLGFKLRHARHLFAQAVFLKAYQAELDTLRNGAKVAAMREVISIMRDAGDGSAAFRKVQLAAAQLVLGPAETDKPNIAVNVGVTLTAGVVVRLPADAPAAPLELQAVTDDE
jgi:hypothetical protein